MKKDIEIKLLMVFSDFYEEKNKIFSEKKCDKNIVYIFKDNSEFLENFASSGITDVSNVLLDLCKQKTTKKGIIIASKYLCDHIIRRYNEKKELTQSQIDDIHARGKITPREKVREWEEMDICAPGDMVGSAEKRCREFQNCHECLLDFAYSKTEYDSLILKPTSIDLTKVYQKNK